jgi:hypothetical protein
MLIFATAELAILSHALKNHNHDLKENARLNTLVIGSSRAVRQVKFTSPES